MHKRSGAVSVIVASVVSVGLVWASLSLADFVRRPSISPTSVPADTTSHARLRTSPISRYGRASVSPSPTPTAALEPQSYSLAAPVFLFDPAVAQTHSIAVGDVSGDGRDDLVFLSFRFAPNPANNRTEIYVAYQRYNGRLDAAVKIGESGNNLSYQLLIADLDRDGIGDIVTATTTGVMVLRPNADGTFTSSTTVVGDPQDMIATDVDRDGYLDVLVDSSDTSATVFHGGVRGGTERTSTLPLPSSAVRTTGDVTGDGLDDLILATIFNRPLEEFRIYPALASGGYAAPVVLSLPLGSNQTSALAVGDFNGDGRGDLALDEAKDFASLRLYFQDSLGNLAPSVDIARQRGASTESLIVADLNHDGRTDLAIGHSGWSYIGYYLQTDSDLAPETVVEAYQSNGRFNYFAAGDINGDGCGDLAITRTSQPPVLLYGQGCTRRRIADCRYPPIRVEGSGLVPTSSASPLVLRRDAPVGGNLRAGPLRSAAARLGRHEDDMQGAQSRTSKSPNRAGMPVVEP